MDIEAATSEAKKLIKSTDLLVIATHDLKDNPWIAAVRYGYDKDYNFYFHSFTTRLHSQHILENPRVAFTIIDAKGDTAIQASGMARIVEPIDLEEAKRAYLESRFADSIERAKHYPKPDGERFFKIEVTKAYIKFSEKVSHDRIEIKLK